MNFDILNSKPLEFFSESGELMGKIFISGSSGDLFIAPVSGTNGDVVLGDRNTVGNVEIGLPSAETTLKLMGGGLISANGQTLTIGDVASGDSVIVNGPITASNILSASYALTASHALNAGGGGGGGSGIFEATGSIFATTNVLEVTGSMTLINTASNSTSSNTLSIEGSGSVSGSGIFDIRGSAGQLFEVQDGLDGVLMSVNDISGIPILTVSSSGNVILAQGSTLIGTASFASTSPAGAPFPHTGTARIDGNLDVTGSGDDIFKVRSQSGSLFSVDDGLDGILMSVNDISGLPLFEISSSGDVELIEGNISGSAASTSSFGHYIGDGSQLSGLVKTTGTPVNNQIATFTDANTVEGTSSFTYDSSTKELLIGASSAVSSEANTLRVQGYNNAILKLGWNNFGGAAFQSGFGGNLKIYNYGASSAKGGRLILGEDGLDSGSNQTNYLWIRGDNADDSAHIYMGANSTTYSSEIGVERQEGIGINYESDIALRAAAGLSGHKSEYIFSRKGMFQAQDAGFTVSGSGQVFINVVTSSISPIQQLTNFDQSLVVSGSAIIDASGSTVFEVVGSEGTLFAIDDSLSGSLFAVTNKTGIPRFEVFSDGKIEKQGNNIQDESFTWFMA